MGRIVYESTICELYGEPTSWPLGFAWEDIGESERKRYERIGGRIQAEMGKYCLKTGV